MPRYVETGLNECTNPAEGDWVQVVDVSATGDEDRRLSMSRLARLGTANALPMVFGPATGLTISNGAITVTGSYHLIDTEGAAATDDLTTINGGVAGQILFMRTTSGGRDVTLKTGTGNLLLGSDFTLGATGDIVLLLCIGASWLKVAFGDN